MIMQPDYISWVGHWPVQPKTLACMTVQMCTDRQKNNWNSIGCDIEKPNKQKIQNQFFKGHHDKVKIIQNQCIQDHQTLSKKKLQKIRFFSKTIISSQGEYVKNQSFQHHHTLLLSKISPYKAGTPTY